MGEEGESSKSIASTVQVSFQNTKISVVKYDGKVNFGLWMSDVQDALNAQNLEETIMVHERPSKYEEAVWEKMNRNACGVIRSCLEQELKYDVIGVTSAMKMWEILNNKYLTKSVENRLHLLRRLFRFQMSRGTSLAAHVNNYTKLLSDLTRVDEKISDEYKAIILLGSLPDEEYDTFVLTLLNGRSSISYSEVTNALTNYDLRRKDKETSRASTSGEALSTRGRSPYPRGGNRSRSKSRSRHQLAKNQCAFCKEQGHWKRDCPKLKEKENSKKKGPKANEVNIAKGDNFDDSCFSLLITPEVNHVDASDWMLDSGATYHVTPRRDWFASFEKVDGRCCRHGK